MNRKEFLKNISAMGGLSLLFPKMRSSENHLSIQHYHFIGLGGCGTRALLEFKAHKLNVTFSAVNVNLNAIKSIPEEVSYNYWDDSLTDDTINWEGIKTSIKRQIRPYNTRDIIDKNSHFVLLAGLGGNTGTRLLNIILSKLKEERRKHSIICTVPYAFEGGCRRKLALDFFKQHQTNQNYHFVDAEIIRKRNPGLKMIDAFRILDNEMYEVWKKKHKLYL